MITTSADFAGLYYYVDGSDSTSLYTDTGLTTNVTTDGDLVKGLVNSGSKSNLTEATNPPTYKTGIVNGKSVIRFASGTQLGLTGETLSGSERYVYVLAANFSTAGDPLFIEIDANNRGLRGEWISSNLYPGLYWNQFIDTYPEQAISSTSLFCMAAKLGNPASWIEGDFGTRVEGNISTIGVTWDQFEINGGTTDATSWDVCEILVLDRELKGQELVDLKTYWNSQWGTSY